MNNKPPLTEEQRQHNKEIRTEVGSCLQLERKNASWLVHVDRERIENAYGVQVDNHILSKQDGIALFNQLCESQGILPMERPEGYMPLQNNVYAYLHQCYQDSYEDALDGIEDGLLDGTGYGLQAVLDKLDSKIRKDSHDFMPKGQNYGDLRYVALNDERKNAIDKYVGKRVMQTLTYEKSKGYEQSTITRFKEQLNDCADKIRATLEDEPVEKGMEL